MIGSQALIAYMVDKKMAVKTFNVSSYKIAPSKIAYKVSDMEAEYFDEMTKIFATIALLANMTTINQPDLKLGIASHMDAGVLIVLLQDHIGEDWWNLRRIAVTHMQSTGPCCKSRQLFLLVYDELPLPGLEDSNKIDRRMSVMKTNNNNKSILLRTQTGEFNHNRWLFETKSTDGYGNPFWPQDVMYGGNEGATSL
ncbi:hypothetical protein NE237_023635 [Protea cynaroides]|uniref:AIR12 DOMON domain-containing protein n=1 Tax=Protea cynaroides TaxID=273540 RepID=A0A9Q0HBV3_9MAGN|nr:hypothetical protein NE237_023635 [Protea cynaroides]